MMAAIACNYCTDYPAVMLLNNLEDGGSDAICANCFPDWLMAAVEALTGVSEAEVAEAIKPAPKARKTKSGPSQEPSSKAPTDIEDGAPVVTTDDLLLTDEQ